MDLTEALAQPCLGGFSEMIKMFSVLPHTVATGHTWRLVQLRN